MRYGRAIKMARAAAGLSQKELAGRAGITNSYLSTVEGDRKTPRIEILERVANALGISVPVLTLLAAEPHELRGIPESVAAAIGGELIHMVMRERTAVDDAEGERKDDADASNN